MASLIVFGIFAFFTGILGIVLGGPFRILVIENDIIDSPIARGIFCIIFFPPVVGVSLLILYWLLTDDPQLNPEHWGMIVGFISGMTYSYRLIDKTNE